MTGTIPQRRDRLLGSGRRCSTVAPSTSCAASSARTPATTATAPRCVSSRGPGTTPARCAPSRFQRPTATLPAEIPLPGTLIGCARSSRRRSASGFCSTEEFSRLGRVLDEILEDGTETRSAVAAIRMLIDADRLPAVGDPKAALGACRLQGGRVAASRHQDRLTGRAAGALGGCGCWPPCRATTDSFRKARMLCGYSRMFCSVRQCMLIIPFQGRTMAHGSWSAIRPVKLCQRSALQRQDGLHRRRGRTGSRRWPLLSAQHSAFMQSRWSRMPNRLWTDPW